jgi:hypothetical protein
MILDALEWLEANPAAYRFLVALIVTIIVNICGYLANKARNKKISYDPGQFVETLLVYEPLIILLAEALPIEYAILGTIILDIWRRTYKALAPTPET